MLTYEDFETLVNSIRDNLDDVTRANASENFITVLSNYKMALDDINSKLEEINKLTGEKEELLLVNGKLYQKVGMDLVEDDNTNDSTSSDSNEEDVSIEEIIDEKGDFING